MSEFVAIIEEAPRGGAFVAIPPQVIGELGGGGRIKVKATFEGIPYRGSIVRMGGQSIIGLLPAMLPEGGFADEISDEAFVAKVETVLAHAGERFAGIELNGCITSCIAGHKVFAFNRKRSSKTFA